MVHLSSLNSARSGGCPAFSVHSVIFKGPEFYFLHGPRSVPPCPSRDSRLFLAVTFSLAFLQSLSLTADFSLYVEQERRALNEARISARQGRNLTGLQRTPTATPGLG